MGLHSPPSGGGPAVRVPPPICDSGYGKVRSACSAEGLSDDAGPSVGDQGRCRDRQVLAQAFSGGPERAPRRHAGSEDSVMLLL